MLVAQAQPQATDPGIERIATYRTALDVYCHETLIIRSKAADLIPFELNRAQRIVHEKVTRQFHETGRIRALVLKARQEGISTYVAARNFRRVTLYENQSALVIADLRKRGQQLFQIYETFDRKLPEWLTPQKRWQRKGLSLHYDTPDGHGLNSTLVVETAKDMASGRGSTFQSVHASEFAFWENPEEPWNALMQSVPDEGSEVFIESTANGVGNLFHRLWVDAEAGDSSYLAIFLPWWIHEEYVKLVSPIEAEQIMSTRSEYERAAMEEGFEYEGEVWKLTVEQIAWRRATIRDKLTGDENLFRQEYPSTAREAFLVSGNCFFDEDALLVYEGEAEVPKRFTLSMTDGGVITRRPHPKGILRVWDDPFHRDRHKEYAEDDPPDGEYVIFADTATGRMSGEREQIFASDREQGGRDFSCAWVYHTRLDRFVACLHQRIPPERFADALYALGHHYGHMNPRTGNLVPALIGVERNHSSGETVVRRLKDDLGYPNLFYDRQLNQRRNRLTPAAGWVTTEAKRTIMLDEFSAWIRDHTGSLPDADTIRECFTFVRGENGKAEAQEGCHDDRVIAASGCLQIARHHRVPALPYERKVVRRGEGVGRLEFEEPRGQGPRDMEVSHGRA